MAIVEARHLRKGFWIPSVRRTTVREHVLGAFRRRSFERLTVLDDVSLALDEGQTLGIMGRNGSGKSTLLKILSGIYQADAGSVAIGAPITPILELGVGWNPELDAIDNILLIGTAMGLSLREARGRIDEVLGFAGLERFANLPLKHYSSGMAARLAYSVAFAAARGILILDEVFAVGDAEFKARCEERYRRLHRQGYTVILVSHLPATVADFCTRALLLEGGRVALEGNGADVGRAYLRMLAAEPDPVPAAAGA
ncbi:MAG TPA: ATP-binding cassette domain-containing protein [Vicinamibacteria bacterium]|nr:ATP-binding cassette domain-containing protein [Vicinamibacteria bacterium]